MKDMNSIIGFEISGTIYTGLEGACLAKIAQNYDRLITLAMAKFMASCDVGKQWDELAKCKPIFKLDDYGNPFVDGECLLKRFV